MVRIRARMTTPWRDPETRAEIIGPVFESVIFGAERIPGLRERSPDQPGRVFTRRLRQAACAVRRVRARAEARGRNSRPQIPCDLQTSSSCFLVCPYRVISPCVGLSIRKEAAF